VHVVEPVDERDITFMELNININNPLLYLKPRIYAEECFFIDLGKIELTCKYEKVYGKVRANPQEWRWMTTYRMKMEEFQIKTIDNFVICKPSNGIVNIHLITYTNSDKLLSAVEFDSSYQFDVMFNEIELNLRQKDYTTLLKCSDLNILYTDNKNELFNY
jgi:hypothetical protein